MFVVMYDLRAMPAGHQTFLRQRTFSVPVRRDSNNHSSRKTLAQGQGRTLRYLVHLRWESRRRVENTQPLRCLVYALLSLPPGSRALSLGSSTFTGTSACCSPGSRWRWTAVLPMSSSPPQNLPSTHHFLLAAEARRLPQSIRLHPLRKLQSHVNASDRLLFSPSAHGLHFGKRWGLWITACRLMSTK